MRPTPTWQYDEMKPCRVDYSRDDQVAGYDTRHRKFRDYARATEEIIRRLALDADSVVIDLCAGTGAFALQAARMCHTVYAVDVSTGSKPLKHIDKPPSAAYRQRRLKDSH